MFVGLVDSRKPDPEPGDERESMWLDLPELRPWRWYVATILCFVVSFNTGSVISFVAVVAGMCCFFWALTTYYQGNDGLSQHRQ